MKSETRLQGLAFVAALTMGLLTSYAFSETSSQTLASPESFAAIGDVNQRSAAIFTELGKVLTSPRCVNCHPAGDRPRQGDERRLHQPPVTRGADGHGTETARCEVCHAAGNFDPGRVPGHHEWHLAPREMAWEGKTLAQICVQLRDPARNGGRKPEDLNPAHRAPTPWSAGPGRPVSAAPLRPARKPRPARWSRPG